jgi:membrane-associated phospholipid phosphatase
LVGTRLNRLAAWARLPQRSEKFLRDPRRALIEAAVLLAVLVLLAIFIPAGPLSLDSRWSELMQDIQTPILKHLALVFNALGKGVWRGLTLAGVGLVLVAARRWAALIAFAVAETLTPLLGNLFKALVTRPRPAGAMLTPHGSSFPSGHAAYAGATVVALVLLFSKPDRKRPRWWALAAVITAGMAWSRTYLQVHWLTDVLAGSLLGVAVAFASFATTQILLERRSTTTGKRPSQATISRTSGL